MAINNVDFKFFKRTIKKDVLEFRKGCEFDKDEWNEAYTEFIEIVRTWKKPYLEKLTRKETVIEWGREFYEFSTSRTHFCWLKKVINNN